MNVPTQISQSAAPPALTPIRVVGNLAPAAQAHGGLVRAGLERHHVFLNLDLQALDLGDGLRVIVGCGVCGCVRKQVSSGAASFFGPIPSNCMCIATNQIQPPALPSPIREPNPTPPPKKEKEKTYVDGATGVANHHQALPDEFAPLDVLG